MNPGAEVSQHIGTAALAEALDASERRFQATFDLAPVGIAHVAPDGRFIRVNAELCRMTGYPCDELARKTFTEITHPEDLDEDWERAEALLRGEISGYSMEKRYFHRDGSVIWVLLTVSLVRHERGEPDYFISVIQDITEKQRLKDQAEESNARFRAIYNEAPVGMAMLGSDYRFRGVNRAFAKMLGRSREQLAGTPVAELTPDAAFTLPAGQTVEMEFVHISGNIVWADARMEPVPELSDGGLVYLATFQDITAWKAAEKLTRQLEERFRWLVEASPMGVVETRRDGTILRANDAFYSMLGWTREEFAATRQSMRSITPPEWIAPSDAHIDSSAGSAHSVCYEKEYLRRDGTRVPVMIALSRDIRRRDLLLVFCADLSLQKRAEAELRASESKLMFAQNAAGAGMFDLDLETGKLEWTSRNYELYGLPKSAQVSTGLWQSMLVAEDRERVMAARVSAIAGEQEFETEFRIRRPDGELRWLAVKAAALRNEAGRAIRFIGLNYDITTRKTAELAVRESELRIRRVADAMPQIVWTSQPNLEVTYYNKRWYEYTGREAGEFGADSWRPVIHPDELSLCTERAAEALANGQDFELHCRLRRADGNYRWHLARSVAIRDSHGSIVEWVGTSTDIDDYKQLSEELERRVLDRTSALRRSLAEKEILLKEVQHRVKNNLQVICSIIGMQIETARGQRGEELLLEAQRRVHAMALVHHRLYDSRNLLTLDFAAYVNPLADELYDMYGVSRSRIRFECSIRAVHLPAAQAIPCGLILNELLANALRHAFGPESTGTIQVRFELEPDTGLFLLQVSDDGKGLPAGFVPERTDSLGFQIVTAMSHQLGASLSLKGGEPGTAICLRFELAA